MLYGACSLRRVVVVFSQLQGSFARASEQAADLAPAGRFDSWGTHAPKKTAPQRAPIDTQHGAGAMERGVLRGARGAPWLPFTGSGSAGSRSRRGVDFRGSNAAINGTSSHRTVS